MSKSVSFLYQLARAANDIEKLSSGDPKRIARRAKNKYIGRKLVRKVWKFPLMSLQAVPLNSMNGKNL